MVAGGASTVFLLLVAGVAILWLFPPTRGLVQLMLDGVLGAFAGLVLIPFRLQFVGVWALAIAWLLFNAPAIYGDDAATQTRYVQLYAISILFIFVTTNTPNPFVGISFGRFMLQLALWLGVFVIVLHSLVPFNASAPVLSTRSAFDALVHAFVVATGEEMLFRYAVPSVMFFFLRPIVAQFFSAIVFGGFHFHVYGGDLGLIAVASAIGFLLGAIVVYYRRGGLIVAIAAHTAYNLSVIGYIGIA